MNQDLNKIYEALGAHTADISALKIDLCEVKTDLKELRGKVDKLKYWVVVSAGASMFGSGFFSDDISRLLTYLYKLIL